MKIKQYKFKIVLNQIKNIIMKRKQVTGKRNKWKLIEKTNPKNLKELKIKLFLRNRKKYLRLKIDQNTWSTQVQILQKKLLTKNK